MVFIKTPDQKTASLINVQNTLSAGPVMGLAPVTFETYSFTYIWCAKY